MPTFTIYATRNSSATMRSRDTASYSNARDGLDTGGNSSNTGTGGFNMYVGQADNSGSTGWSYDTTGLIFDTSSVSGTVTAATLEIYAVSTVGTPDWDIEARVHDFGGSVAAWPTDFVDADNLAAKTLVATLTKSAVTASAYNTFTDVALAANIIVGGSTELILASSRSRTATAPGAGLTERVNFTSPLSPMGANGPRLVITTAAVPEGALTKTLDAATLSSAGALAISGLLSITTNDATLSAAANLIGVGEGLVNAALADATLSSTIGIETFGYATVTAADATLSSVGALATTGSFTVTLEGATLSAVGAKENSGVLSVTLADATLVTSTLAGITGSVSVTLENATLSALQSGPAWPVVYRFPQRPISGTWRRVHGDDTLRSSEEVGARRYLGRDGGDYADVAFEILLNGNLQIKEMDRFFAVDCAYGSRRFFWPHPETGVVMPWTWAVPPNHRFIAGSVVRCECQLRMEAK